MKYFAKYWFVLTIVFVVFIFIKPAVCFCVSGLIVLYLCVNTILVFNGFKKHGIIAAGNIVSFEEDNDNNTIPVIEFKTLQGELINAKPTIYSSRDARSFKKEVNIIYRPHHPQQFILSDEKVPYFGLILGLLLSVGCIIVSTCIITGLIKL